MDSYASFAGEVERNVSPDNDFSLRGKLHQMPPLVVSASLPASSLEVRKQAAPRVELQQLHSEFTSEPPSSPRRARPARAGR